MIKPGERKNIFVAVFVVTILAITVSLAATAEFSEQKNNSQSTHTRFLVLDSRIIDKTSHAKLTLGKVHKHPQNPLFEQEKQWEPHFSNMYPNVIYDEADKLYKCWYTPHIINKACSTTPRSRRIPGSKNYITRWEVHSRFENLGRETGVCYAVSKDGICWEKPELGVVEFNGSNKNNIVMRGPHGAGVFKDLHEKDAEKRYKMIFLDAKSRTMHVSFSPDGVHWSKPIACLEIEVRGDTHNNSLWAPDLGKYVLISRLKTKSKGRVVARSESTGFLKWTKGEIVLTGVDKTQQIYSMPIFRYGSIYIGLPTILERDELVHTELAWSPDTINWHHINPGMPLIPNAEKWWGREAYDCGCIYVAACPIFLENEIRLYYLGANGPHSDWREGFFCLATLRPDGFAGYEPTSDGATAIITTKPVTCTGNSLNITADVRGGGSLRVAIVDEQYKKLADGNSIDKTVTDGKVLWTDNFEISSLSDKKIRLKFVLHKAKLYSFRFK